MSGGAHLFIQRHGTVFIALMATPLNSALGKAQIVS